MKKRHIAAIIGSLLLMRAGTAAYVVSPAVHDGTDGEAPELGRPGAYQIGTKVKAFDLAGRTTITAWGAVSGNLAETERQVEVRFWYPAEIKPGARPAEYSHEMKLPGKEPIPLVTKGRAISGAIALTDQKYPLVLMSHGFGGWDTQFSNLAEHIASHGYIVASINHKDAPIDGVTSFLLSFGNVLVDRTLDQRQILGQIVQDASNAQDYAAQIDPDNIALIGYSMGGYGAIASSGADYDFSSEPMSNVPEASQQSMQDAAKTSVPIKALVAIAPWGGQPDNRAWTAESLNKIKQPALFISGNQDDVVNFEEGVTWLFNNMTGSDRYMLVYREARHNIVGNKFDLPEDSAFAASEFLNEPVWRSERINAINQHFVTAFLDLHLKDDAAKADYLNVPVQDSNASAWPTGFGEQLNGKLAGPEQENHWRGFQKRWAVGLEMHHLEKQE